MPEQTRQMTLQVLLSRLRSATSGRTITQEQLNTIIVRPSATPSCSAKAEVFLHFFAIFKSVSRII